MSADPREAQKPRDTDATGFTQLLDTLLQQLPEGLCVVFVDGEGETVDFAARIDPFDARITGAELAIALHGMRRSAARMSSGETLELRVEGHSRSILVRHVSKGYDLVVLIGTPTITARHAELTAATAIALMVEAGIPPPPSYAVLRSVEQRPSRTGFAVPTVFEEGTKRRKVESILGHRQDPNELKFLVRLDDGEELVVAFESATGKWRRT